MPLEAYKELHTWLHMHGLGGYLRVVDALPHLEAQVSVCQMHPDTITNSQIRSMLGLK